MKNKSLITNICSAALSLLVIIFLALPYVGNSGFSISGYDCFEVYGYLGNIDDFAAVMMYLLPLFMLIFSIIILAFSIINILGDVKVLKSEKFLKVSRLINLIIAIVLAVLVVVGFILILANEISPAVGLILNLIFVIATMVATILTFVWAKK